MNGSPRSTDGTFDRPYQFAAEHAAAFEDSDVVADYRYRAPYAPSAFDALLTLMDPVAPAVLDLGTGPGPIARALAPRVARVDAVDPSEAMIAAARDLAGGDAKNIRWLMGRAEDVVLDPPYGLATAGTSIHWMDWDVLFSRVDRALSPRGRLVILYVEDDKAPWQSALRMLFVKYSVYGERYQEIDVVAELEHRGSFRTEGREGIAADFSQPLDDYVRSLHSHSSLARSRIGVERAREFDEEVARVIPIGPDGLVHREVVTRLVWGRPAPSP